MPKPVITYNRELPEIPERRPDLPPDSYLRRKELGDDEFEIVEGRRPSKLFLVNRLRDAIGKWRGEGYPGASSVTHRLFTYWFEEDHLIDGKAFRYYFGQREAVETLAYLTEVAGVHDDKTLVDLFGEIFYPAGTQAVLEGLGLIHQTGTDGRRQIRRWIPELQGEVTQDLPAENLRRYAFKMATGSGKTVVMAMVVVWSYFHRKMVGGSDLSTNFLVLAPNVIVYQRLEKDFASNRVFQTLPLIPPEWKPQWSLKVITRGEGTEPDPSGTLFLTNIQQVYESKETTWTPINAVDALLGRKPNKDLASQERSMLERIRSLPNLVVLNDEAHHVHDEELQWNRTLMGIHEALPSGLALWLDFSATPKDQNGSYFPWIICDYPLAQAVEDRIVKAPLIVHEVKKKDPQEVRADNVIEAYGEWIVAGVERWKEHYATYKPLGQKPVLFIMAEKNDLADEIGKWLVETEAFGLKKSEVLIIHIKEGGKEIGEVQTKDLEELREAARDIDQPGNRIKVIVSVLMLREGWDVRNVTIVLGLRPFSAKPKILPEQAVGRGLRLMQGISPDRTQTLEVMGTDGFEAFVRELETEGVGIKTVSTPPPPPVQVEPVMDKLDRDIVIPLTKPSYTHDYRRVADLDPLKLAAIYDQEELAEPVRLRLKMDFATTETEVHQMDVASITPPMAQQLVATITNRVMAIAKLTGGFAELYPLVRTYLASRCFGREIDLDDEGVRSHLRRPVLQEGIAKYLAREIGHLTVEKKSVEFEQVDFRLSKTTRFSWRRNLPLLSCKKTIFNMVATYNDYEKDFAKFLEEKCGDIVRFASLGTTEQESGTQFKVDYIKPSGAIGFYYPDWVAVQQTPQGEINWIVETKGRVWESTPVKDDAICDWCGRVSEQTGTRWEYVRVNQLDFAGSHFSSFADLISKMPYSTC